MQDIVTMVAVPLNFVFESLAEEAAEAVSLWPVHALVLVNSMFPFIFLSAWPANVCQMFIHLHFTCTRVV